MLLAGVNVNRTQPQALNTHCQAETGSQYVIIHRIILDLPLSLFSDVLENYSLVCPELMSFCALLPFTYAHTEHM